MEGTDNPLAETTCQAKTAENSAEKQARAGPRGLLGGVISTGIHGFEKKGVYNTGIPALTGGKLGSRVTTNYLPTG
jgi:hypothetical protein